MLKATPSHQSALSLIEILVAVTLISFVLIALASNIFYTQRVIIDARLRAKAVDQANSCLERWRTARDGMLWWQFYQRLKENCTSGNINNSIRDCNGEVCQTVGGWQDEIVCRFPYKLPAYDILNRPAGKFAEDPVLDYNKDPTKWGIRQGIINCSGGDCNVNDVICGQPAEEVNNDPNFKLGYHGRYQVSLQFEPGSPTNPEQTITVSVTVQYQDYKGKEKQVQVAQKFSRDIKNELPYQSTP